MSDEKASEKLVQVTNITASLRDGSTITWTSFRPASLPADANPTVYFGTLAASPQDGATLVKLFEIGAQCRDTTKSVEIIAMADGAELTQTDGTKEPLPANKPVAVCGCGTGASATIQFSAETCSIKVLPPKVGSGVSAQSTPPANPPPGYPTGSN